MFNALTSSSSMSQEVLIVSLSSEYFHLDKSYLLDGCSTFVDLLQQILIYKIVFIFIKLYLLCVCI